tara:strand:- start:7 stop:264 length:258 start_codon:yes stop_codon:yes gene_type:complete
MIKKLENLKKKLIYRASYRGTKEMDILLTSFVNKYIDQLDKESLKELESFLNFEDETILNFYRYNISNNEIEKNKISKIFKNYKI